MRDPIKDALPFLMSDEQAQTVEAAIDLLTELGQSAPQDDIALVIDVADDNADTALTVSRITDILDLALTQQIREIGVSLIAEASLVFKVAMLTTLTSIEHYVIPTEIQDILISETDNEETLARLVPVITDVSMEETLDTVTEVQDYTIARFKEIITAKLNSMEQPAGVVKSDHHQRIAMINRLLNLHGKEQASIAYSFLDAGVGIGLPLTSLLNQSLPQLDELDENRTQVPIERLSLEILVLVLISDEPLATVKNKAITIASDLNDEAIRINRLSVIITEYCKAIGF